VFRGVYPDVVLRLVSLLVLVPTVTLAQQGGPGVPSPPSPFGDPEGLAELDGTSIQLAASERPHDDVSHGGVEVVLRHSTEVERRVRIRSVAIRIGGRVHRAAFSVSTSSGEPVRGAFTVGPPRGFHMLQVSWNGALTGVFDAVRVRLTIDDRPFTLRTRVARQNQGTTEGRLVTSEPPPAGYIPRFRMREVEGGIPSAIVRRVLRQLRSRVVSCAAGLGEAGREVELTFTIVDGRIQQLLVRHPGPTIRSCVETELRRARFPATSAPTRVTATLEFLPR